MFSFLLGCCSGSFLNVLIFRIPRKMSLWGRSCCPYCSHSLSFFEMIPIVSYLFLRGRCRCCQHKISFQYPLVELLSGILFYLCISRFGISWLSLIYLLTCVVLIVISVIDYHTMVIPDGFNLILVLLCICHCFVCPIGILNRTVGFFVVSLPLYILSYYKDCFGGGDIKLFAIMGYMLGGVRIVIAFVCAVLLCGLYSIFLLLFKKVKRNLYIAFAPFISLGIGLSLFYSNEIVYFYMNLM